MPKHKRSRRDRRSRSRSGDIDDDWLKKRLAELQRQVQELSALEPYQRVQNENRPRENEGISEFCDDGDSTRHSLPASEEIGNNDLSDGDHNLLGEDRDIEGTSSSPVSQFTEHDLDEDLKIILGSEPPKIASQGPPVHQAIANRWNDLLQEGVKEDIKAELINKYLTPENLNKLVVPKLNPEIHGAISSLVLRRDERLAQKQQQLGAGISAIGRAISFLLKKEGGGDRECLQFLSDAGRILCDFHHSEAVTRRELILINLNKSIKETLAEAPIDKYLFGESLEERLKIAKNMEKSSHELKLIKPKTLKTSFAPAAKALNSRGLPRTARGARGGHYQQTAPHYQQDAPQHRQTKHNYRSLHQTIPSRRPPRTTRSTGRPRQQERHQN